MKLVNLIAGLGIFTTAGCMLFTRTTDAPPAPPCGKQHPLQVISLAYFPDPLPEARRIDQWRAVIRSDSAETCRTRLQIVEKDNDKAASPPYTVHITSGTNEILMNSLEQYRLAGSEVCFQAVVELDGATGPLPGPQRSCARPIDKGLWSMR